MNGITDTGTVTLQTARLTLRPFTRADAEEVYKSWASLSEVTEFLSWRPHSSPKVTIDLVDTWVHQYKFRTTYNWCIELSCDKGNRLAGNIAVTRRGDSSAELAYLIAPRFWGMGLASEAVRAVCSHLFETVGYSAVLLRIPAENKKSRRVAEKCGFTLSGVTNNAATNHRGESLNLAEYSLSRM